MPPDTPPTGRATAARGGPGGLPQRRDLERYAALFASRTSVMKSSAMRDLMAITERPEVISLAGGLPDTSTFPAESLAALLSKLAATDSARALQYAPTEGMAAVGEAIATVMAAEDTDVDPEDVLVTTGGQQVIDLVCKTLVDPGDVIVAEAPTYPGAVPAFSAYQADVVQIAMDDDGMRVDELEETLARLEREGRRPKFIYTIPTFQNPAGVTMSLPRRQRLVEVAHERELLVLEDNPYGLLRYEGEPLPTLRSLDGGEFVIYLGTFSKILSPGIRLGWTVAPRPGAREDEPRQAGQRPVLVVAVAALRRRPTSPRAAGRTTSRRCASSTAAGATRCSTRWPSTCPREASWTRPSGGLFIWATLPDYIDTTDLLALGLSRNVAFVPGRAAYLDGRGGSSMRLNFSGVDDDAIREGVRRIGEVVREQVELYGTLTGVGAGARAGRACAGAARSRAGRRARAAAPRRPRRAGREMTAALTPAEAARLPTSRRAPMSSVAVLKGGRSLERQVSLRSGARVEDALERLGHEVVGIDVGHDLVDAAARGGARRRLRRAARPRRRGRHRPGAARGRSASPTPPRGCRRACAARTRSWPSTRCATRASRRPTSTRSPRPRSRSSGRRDALGEIEERLRFPIVVKPADQGSALGIRFAAEHGRRAGRDRRRLLVQREGAARALRARPRARGLDPRRRGAADRRGGTARGGLLRLLGALHDRAHGRSCARPSWATS